ncbi:MAG: Xaa-Pro aminopeptidase [Candidatus Fermentibacteraceae bacterium]
MTTSSSIFVSRRRRLYERLGDGFLAVVPSSSVKASSADASHPHVPSKNLFYLTGITQPRSWLLAWKTPGGEVKERLLIDRYDEHYAKWVGAQISPDEATELSGVEDVAFNENVPAQLDRLLVKKQLGSVWLDFPLDGISGLTGARSGLAGRLASAYPHLELRRLSEEIFRLRMVKEPGELEQMRKAIELTRKGFEHALSRLGPGMMEYEFEAEMRYQWLLAGERQVAFHPIVAGGGRATCLHYVDNDNVLEEGQLLLLDFGAQYGLYNADISRTVPVSGKYTARQRELVSMVIAIQARAIELLRPGILHSQWNDEVNEAWAEMLTDAGIIDCPDHLDQVYYHRIGHHIGLDTHDESLAHVELEPGMVLTVEPGLYLAEEGTGIRIEDDVLIGEDGNTVLSADFPRTPDQIEAIMAREG